MLVEVDTGHAQARHEREDVGGFENSAKRTDRRAGSTCEGRCLNVVEQVEGRHVTTGLDEHLSQITQPRLSDLDAFRWFRADDLYQLTVDGTRCFAMRTATVPSILPGTQHAGPSAIRPLFARRPSWP
ncbi:hypothetical protein [Nocardia fluminea]|uniref:hypothetical protein n=1 Tax=Nocardia fluminea TaxID=134984 RepID=UPI003D0FB18D